MSGYLNCIIDFIDLKLPVNIPFFIKIRNAVVCYCINFELHIQGWKQFLKLLSLSLKNLITWHSL